MYLKSLQIYPFMPYIRIYPFISIHPFILYIHPFMYLKQVFVYPFIYI